MLLARAQPQLSRGEKKGLGAEIKTQTKVLFSGSFHPMLEANQDGERVCRVLDAQPP